jgi:hypothetical protein
MMMLQEQLQLLKWQNISVPLKIINEVFFLFFAGEGLLVGSKHLAQKN